MIAKQLYLKNYRSYKEATITFDKTMHMIVGDIIGTHKSNGSGKSSIFEAIYYALEGDIFFNPSGAKSSKLKNDELIHNDEKEMEVAYSFELDGVDYIIKRKIKRGKAPTIHVSKEGQPFEDYQVKSGQEIIDNIIGVSAEILLTTSYFKQGQLDTFSKLQPKDSKDMVLKILQIDQYSKYEQVAKDNIKNLEEEITSMRSKESVLEGQISAEQNKKTESKYTQEQLDKLLEVQEELVLIASLNAMLTETQDDYRIEIKDQIDELKKDRLKIDFNKQAKATRLAKFNKLVTTTDCVCPTCECAIDKDIVNIIINELNQELDSIKNEGDILSKSMGVFQTQLRDITNLVIPLESKYTQSQLASKITEVKMDLKVQEINKDTITKLKKDLTKVRKEIKRVEEEVTKYSKLRVAFGKKGIQAFIVENAIPEIQATTNAILKELDTPIQINIKSQKDLKSGGKAETFDISVFTSYGERSYMSYSGGEKTFIDFALRLSLSVLLSRRMNFTMQTLILDEVFGELDAVNKLQAVKVLHIIAQKFDFKRILIISHQEELKDNFENLIRVQHNGEESVIL